MVELHHWMPMVLPPEAWDTWLVGETAPWSLPGLVGSPPLGGEALGNWNPSPRAILWMYQATYCERPFSIALTMRSTKAANHIKPTRRFLGLAW